MKAAMYAGAILGMLVMGGIGSTIVTGACLGLVGRNTEETLNPKP